MGIHCVKRVWHLKNFDRYCTDRALEDFDRSTVEGWVTSRQSKQPNSCQSWMSYIRDFGRWERINGNENAYVLSDQWKMKRIRPQPYVLSLEEIGRFFDAAARLKTTSPWKWQAVAFFALMHSCGLRTCEVRRLQRNDVNLAECVIDVRWSKGNRSRQLPLTEQIVDILAACDQALQRPLGIERLPFFVSATGDPVTAGMIAAMFNWIWDQARLPRSRESKGILPEVGFK